MRTLSFVLLASLALTGCRLQPSPPEDYAVIAERIDAGEDVGVDAIRASFLATPDFDDRLQKLTPLEQQAMQLFEDEPLRLGAIGSAILDTYYASLVGHFALERFYEHVEAPDATRRHQRWVEKIEQSIHEAGDGTDERPYPVLSAWEAQAFLRREGMVPVGSMYASSDEVPFMMLIAAQPNEGALRDVFFDLTATYEAVHANVAQDTDDGDGDDEAPFTPGMLINFLAQRDDSAAQTAIGSFLYSQERHAEAAQWLRAATQSGNVLANILLAEIYQSEAERLEGAEREQALELALDHYTHAIALSSDDAMFALGGLYVDGYYGDENIPSGIALLHQAAELENTNAMLWLAFLYSEGEHVEEDLDEAAGYLHNAAELGNTRAKLQYARFLLAESDQRPFDPKAMDWLRELAEDEDDATAMLLLGNLNARGVGASQSFSRARDWYKSAVETDPDDAELVNEVAWTLAVTHFEQLREPDYALEIMERVMTQDTQARKNSAYLDTWAAAYAANGNFERAVTVQHDAIATAEANDPEDVVAILKQHLEAFEAREAVIDPIP